MTKEELKEYRKALNIAHRDENLAKQKAYHIAHRDKEKAYRIAHREASLAKKKALYIEHREDALAKKKAYHIEHREEIKAKVYCSDIENIENYALAKADNFSGWDVHHRLETHTSDGQRRLVDLSRKELISLGTYYHRPADELIFMRHGEHMSLHNRAK